MRPAVAEHFERHVYFGGLTYGAHPLALASALATISVYEEDGLIENARKLGEVMRAHHTRLAGAHPSVGAVRNIGLFGVLELIRDRTTLEPLAGFNGSSDEMNAVERHLLDHGLYTFVRWWNVMTNPPLCITEKQLAEGFAIIDGALSVADRSVKGA
jgi:taurine---2-oxoglutarate transaminase